MSALPVVWFALLGFILLLYTTLDGFDLGAGILSLFLRDEKDRGLVMGSLGSIWDANETWLVLFGGVIFGAFPTVYGLVMSALYLPLILMLAGLIFRAVSFEFRVHSRSKRLWSLCFGWGSVVAGACQGFAFGGVLWGIRSAGGSFTGGPMDWLTPFSVVMALAVLGGYVMLGSTYLVMKTGGALQHLSRRSALAGASVAGAGAVAATILAVEKHSFLAARWLSFPGFLLTLVPFFLSALSFVSMISGILGGRERLPFASALSFAFFGYLALSANFFPVIVPPSITVYSAASQPEILHIMLVSIGAAIPVLLAYNLYQYWVFRGKVTKNVYEED